MTEKPLRQTETSVRRIPPSLIASLKVWLVCVSSILAVAAASVIIIIIQFQGRLAAAGVQNAAITSETVHLLAEYQKAIYSKYIKLSPLIEQFTKSSITYSTVVTQINALVISACQKPSDGKSDDECMSHLYMAVNTRSTSIDVMAPRLQNKSAIEEIKLIIGGNLNSVQDEYLHLKNELQATCQILQQYIGPKTTAVAVPPALKMIVHAPCNNGSLATFAAESAQKPPEEEKVGSGLGDVLGFRASDNTLVSELIFNYRFYDALFFRLGPLLDAPTEFITIMLVIICGMLGSFLFHTYSMFSAKTADEYPSMERIALRSILAVMCALVVYILSRTGLVVLTEQGPRTAEVVFSPFAVAMLSVMSGLLAERALRTIRHIGAKAFDNASVQGRTRPDSGGQKD